MEPSPPLRHTPAASCSRRPHGPRTPRGWRSFSACWGHASSHRLGWKDDEPPISANKKRIVGSYTVLLLARRPIHLVDHHYRNRMLLLFQFQSELLIDRLENRDLVDWRRGFRRR